MGTVPILSREGEIDIMPEHDEEQPQVKATDKKAETPAKVKATDKKAETSAKVEAGEKASDPSPRKGASRVALVFSLIALVIAVAAGAASAFVIYQQVKASKAAPLDINAPAKDATLLHGQWVQANLASGNHYYGRLTYDRSLRAYLLWNAWWANTPTDSKGATTGPTTYSKVGSELYKPLPYMVINPQNLYTWQELPASSSVLQEIKITAGYTDVVEPKAADIKNAKYSAVFLTDQSVLYGTIVRNGTQVGIKNAFVMMRKDASAKADQPITSLNDLQLIPQKDIARGVGDTLWINSSVLVNYVTLSDQSPVVQAIQQQ